MQMELSHKRARVELERAAKHQRQELRGGFSRLL